MQTGAVGIIPCKLELSVREFPHKLSSLQSNSGDLSETKRSVLEKKKSINNHMLYHHIPMVANIPVNKSFLLVYYIRL